MRIIAGKYRGHLLQSIRDVRVRPVTDRVKGSIFNSLQNRLNLIDARVLDLFAGTGSLGFEALSRGAAEVQFVDDDQDILDVLKLNAQKLGCLDECRIMRGNALQFLENMNDEFSLIFADPPYAYEDTSILPRLIFQRKLISRDGFLIIEHSKQTMFEESSLYKIVHHKRFGNTIVSFFGHPENREEQS